jgi:uncharacterized protein
MTQMGDMSSEPSMEDILSSIKKIIAEDSTKAAPRPRAAARPSISDENVLDAETRPAAVEGNDEVLELTEATAAVDAPTVMTAAPIEPEIVSEQTRQQSRSSLDSLSKLLIKPENVAPETLEGLVRDMLRPMLKDWLDAKLPGIVEAAVDREVARISGRGA